VINQQEQKEKEISFFHPSGRFYAFCVLLCLGFVSLGGFFSFDSIGVVQADMEKELKINSKQFGLLYSIYSIPNCILPFVGGFLLDRFGVRFGLFVCCTVITLGNLLVAWAPSFGVHAYTGMLAGRLLFGIGAETSYVAQNTILINWFRDKEMALAMGLCISAGRLGTWLTFGIIPFVANLMHTWRVSGYLAFLLTAFELTCVSVYVVLEKAAEHKLGRKINQSAENSTPINVRDVRNFPGTYWLFTAIAATFYAAIFPFQSTATSLLQSRYNYSNVKAAATVSLLPLIPLALTPVIGILVDKVGHRITFCIVGMLAMVAGNLGMIMTHWNPVIFVSVIGVAFSIVPAALWPCFPLIIDENYIGTAYGLLQSVNNLAMVIMYYMAGFVNDMFDQNPVYVLIFFTGLLICAVILTMAWWIVDRRTGKICESVTPPK